jgi:NAD(P)H dehydrogenase (quinone)
MSVKVLIAFYSRTGSTEILARSIADGARAAGAEVRLRRARELVAPDVIQSVPGWPEAAARMNALYDAPTGWVDSGSRAG